MQARSTWLQQLWDDSLQSGRGYTPQEAMRMFGVPQANVAAEEHLEDAAREGWFRREKWIDEVGGMRVRRCRYFAIRREEQPKRRQPEGESYFGRMPMVNSIFHLGAAL